MGKTGNSIREATNSVVKKTKIFDGLIAVRIILRRL